MRTFRGGGRRRVTSGVVFVLVLPFMLSTTGCPGPDPIVPEVDAHRIVFQNARSSFEVFLDADTHRAPLETFLEQTRGAQTRRDLSQAWSAIPELAAEGAAFLEENVFESAQEDGDWPSDPPDEKSSYVDGTRDAVTAFLGEG
ncbi:MAG: hypothetical protein ACYTG6_01525 [Planctomycetota bacterium]|jgi:hypothetical protein